MTVLEFPRPDDDIGRRFLVTRTQSLTIALTEEDVDDQQPNETAHDSARIIAEHSPDSSWTTEDIDVTELR